MLASETKQNNNMARIIMVGSGFSLLLAWHYLILFSPAFGDIDASGEVDDVFLFARQLTLYVMIALTFAFFSFLKKWRKAPANARVTNLTVTTVTGILALVVGALYVLAPYLELDFALRLALIGILGVLQASMMTLWVRFVVQQHGSRTLLTFGTYMISGGVIAVVVCYFQWPVSLVAAVLLPFLSSVFLGMLQSRYVPESEEKEEDEGQKAERSFEASREPDANPKLVDKIAKARNARLIIFSGIFAFTFGLLQGSFIVVNIPILIVTNAVVLIGIVLAGFILQMLPKNASALLAVDLMHRFSVILFVVGTVIIMWFDMGWGFMVVSQIILLAGFNLFDFGLFIFGVEGHWGVKDQALGTDISRPLVYLSMAFGLVIGYLVLTLVEVVPAFQMLLIICGVCIIMIVATTFTPILKYDSRQSSRRDEVDDSAESAQKANASLMSLSAFPTSTSAMEDPGAIRVTPWKNACNVVATSYKLSPRETEIFFLMARGRNADYIQKQLVISPHTAKTHIANIYHKLDVHSAQELLDLVEEQREKQRSAQ